MPEFRQIIQSGFRTRQNDDVGLQKVLGIIGIEKIDSRVALQYIEISEIRYMAQQDNSYVQLGVGSGKLKVLPGKANRVLFLDMNIIIIRYNAKNGYSANILHHPAAFLEESHIPSELIDENTLDILSVSRRLQHDTAID